MRGARLQHVNQRLSAERLQQLLKAEKSTREALAAEVAHLKTLLAAAGAETTAPSGAEPEGAPTGVAKRAEEPGKDGDGDEGSPPASNH
ncbi:hypothetical protein HaLaN_19564 [Haematococcus lacustris]|uniref:Uncharacterized protein n=1 Tax=Haematococcus lacustris TaxID=44745 RepID=A0A699ZTY4_HAELA|nr:hypothetical protein HaLaN_19564 [Haematococcus lacustris]